MHNAYVVTGTITDSRTVTLDEMLPMSATRVRLVVDPLVSPNCRSHAEVVSEIHARQRARGHQPPSPAEVDAYLQCERDSWED